MIELQCIPKSLKLQYNSTACLNVNLLVDEREKLIVLFFHTPILRFTGANGATPRRSAHVLHV